MARTPSTANSLLTLWKGWWMWLIAALFYALDYFQHTAPSVLLQPIAHSLNVPYTHIGNIMALYFPIYALSQLPAGYLLDRYNPRWVLSCACTVVACGVACSTLPFLTTLALGRVLVAIGSAAAFLGALKVASSSLPSRWFPLAVGLTNTIGVCGGLVGQPVFNQFITKVSWQTGLQTIAAAGLGLALIISLFLRLPTTTPKQSATSTDWRSCLRHRNLWRLALYAGIMVGTVVNAFSELYDVTYLQQTQHLSAQQAANLSSMIFIGIAVGGPCHSLITRLVNTKHWMLLTNLATILTFSAITMATPSHLSVSAQYPLYFLTGFFVSSMLLAFSYTKKLGPSHQHAQMFAIINMTIGLCGFLFQELLGYLIPLSHHWPSGMAALLLPLACSFILLLRVKV